MFWHFGLYRGVWRFASVLDLMRIVKASAVGVALTALSLFPVTRMQGVPRSALPLYGLLLVVLLGGPRLVLVASNGAMSTRARAHLQDLI